MVHFREARVKALDTVAYETITPGHRSPLKSHDHSIEQKWKQ
jgi:hypothetical protein